MLALAAALLIANVPLPATLDQAHRLIAAQGETIARLEGELKEERRRLQEGVAAPASTLVKVEAGGSLRVEGTLNVFDQKRSSGEAGCPVCSPCAAPPPPAVLPPSRLLLEFIGHDAHLSTAPGQVSKLKTPSGLVDGNAYYVSAWTANSVAGPGVSIRFQCATAGAGSVTNTLDGKVGLGWKMIGFKGGDGAAHTTGSTDYQSIDYGVACAGGSSNNGAWVHKGGNWNSQSISSATPYTSSMVFEVRLTSTGVKWYLDGVEVDSEAVSITYPLHVAAYVHNVQDPALFNIEWIYHPPSPPTPPPLGLEFTGFNTDCGGCLTSTAGTLSRVGDGGNYYNAWTASSVAGPDVGIRFQCATDGAGSMHNGKQPLPTPKYGPSQVTALVFGCSLTRPCVFPARAAGGLGWKMIGFKSGTGSSSTDYQSIDYGVACAGGSSNNGAWVHKGGNWNSQSISSATPYTSSMVFEVRLTSTGVTWYLDGAEVDSEAVSISYPLHVVAYVYNQQDPALFNIEWT